MPGRSSRGLPLGAPIQLDGVPTIAARRPRRRFGEDVQRQSEEDEIESDRPREWAQHRPSAASDPEAGVRRRSHGIGVGRTTPRRLVFLSALAVVLGLVGGGAAFVLVHLIAIITNATLFHRVGLQWAGALPSFSNAHFGPGLVIAATLGALFVSFLAKWSPVIKGHGLPEAMEAVLTRQSRISPRAALAKPLSAAIAIGTGGPFGAEGPIIVTGGAIGSLIGQALKVSPSERKILLASGAAAGMSATFGAPLASVMLAIELLMFEYSARALVPLVIASSIAAGVHYLAFGPGALFPVPPHSYAGLSNLPYFALLGVAIGLLAIVVCRGLFVVEDGFRKLPVPEFWHPVIGAVGFAVVGYIMPRALSVGYDQIGAVLADKVPFHVIPGLAVAKLVAWWIALASGTSGGTLAPLLLIGGSFGSLMGYGLKALVPGLALAPGAFAVVAMAALFGAAARAPFTAIVFIFELTHDYQIILPLMLATVIADLIARTYLPESIMTDKLARRGLRVLAEYHMDYMESTPVREVMTRDVRTLPATATVAQARREFATSQHGAYPVLNDQGGVAGIISRGDMLREDFEGDAPISQLASEELVSVTEKESVATALQLMLQEGVDHLPVLQDGQLVGICTRADVLHVRQRQLDLEMQQAGWKLRRRRKAATISATDDEDSAKPA